MRRIALAFVFALLAFGLLAFFLHHTHDTLLLGVLAGVVFAGVAIALASGVLAVEEHRIVVTTAPPPPVVIVHPYRGAAPAAGPPRLSGQRLALVLFLALAATAAAVPFLLHRAPWVEIELTLAAWWAIWAVLVGVVTFRGLEAADDYALSFAIPLGAPRAPGRRREGSRFFGILGDILSCACDGEAFIVAILVVIALFSAFAGAWLVLEVLFPCLFFVAYAALLGALRRSGKPRAGSFRAAGAGIVWASVYTTPLALVVWLVHTLS